MSPEPKAPLMIELWQVILIAFLVLLPLALLVDFWPHRERLDSRGHSLPRDWRPATTKVPEPDHH